MKTQNYPQNPSDFKPWLRIAAFILCLVFLPGQLSWAIEYNWQVIYPRTAYEFLRLNYLSLSLNTPLKELRDIQNRTLLKYPEKKSCGSKALYNYLKRSGQAIEEQDIAVLDLAIDILKDVIKPEGNPKIIKTSLFALAKTSEFFGHKLIPVKLSAIRYPLSANLTPFIAHLKEEHYVLVTQIDEEKIYFIDQAQEEFLPYEKFLEQFSGYALIPDSQGWISELLVSEEEAKTILGARRSRQSAEGADWGKWAIMTGISVVGSVALSGLQFGKAAQAQGVYNVGGIGYKVPDLSGLAGGMGRAFVSFQISNAIHNVGSYYGMKPSQINILSSAVNSAALSGIGGMEGAYGNLGPWSRVGVGALAGGVSAGVTEGISPTRPGRSPSALAQFAGMTAGIFTTSAMTAGLGGYQGQGMSETLQVKGVPDGGYSPSQWTSAVWNIGFAANKYRFAENIVRVGIEEALGRDSSFNKMIGNVGGIGSSLDQGDNLSSALLQGAARGGLSIGVAKLEKMTGMKNPFLEALIVNTATSAIKGAISPQQTVWGAIQNTWQQNGLDVLTLGWSSRQNTLWGNVNYMNNLHHTTLNMARTSFAQGFVQYATDVYHYGSVGNIMEGLKNASSLTARISGQLEQRRLAEKMRNITKDPYNRSIFVLPNGGSFTDPDNGFSAHLKANGKYEITNLVTGEKLEADKVMDTFQGKQRIMADGETKFIDGDKVWTYTGGKEGRVLLNDKPYPEVAKVTQTLLNQPKDNIPIERTELEGLKNKLGHWTQTYKDYIKGGGYYSDNEAIESWAKIGALDEKIKITEENQKLQNDLQKWEKFNQPQGDDPEIMTANDTIKKNIANIQNQIKTNEEHLKQLSDKTYLDKIKDIQQETKNIPVKISHDSFSINPKHISRTPPEGDEEFSFQVNFTDRETGFREIGWIDKSLMPERYRDYSSTDIQDLNRQLGTHSSNPPTAGSTDTPGNIPATAKLENVFNDAYAKAVKHLRNDYNLGPVDSFINKVKIMEEIKALSEGTQISNIDPVALKNLKPDQKIQLKDMKFFMNQDGEVGFKSMLPIPDTDIKAYYEPKTGKYNVTIDKSGKTFEVDFVVDKLVLGGKELDREMSTEQIEGIRLRKTNFFKEGENVHRVRNDGGTFGENQDGKWGEIQNPPISTSTKVVPPVSTNTLPETDSKTPVTPNHLPPTPKIVPSSSNSDVNKLLNAGSGEEMTKIVQGMTPEQKEEADKVLKNIGKIQTPTPPSKVDIAKETGKAIWNDNIKEPGSAIGSLLMGDPSKAKEIFRNDLERITNGLNRAGNWISGVGSNPIDPSTTKGAGVNKVVPEK